MSDMRNPEVIEQARRLITSLTDPRTKQDAERIREEDPLILFRTNVLGFFKHRIEVIDELEAFRREVRESMRQDNLNNVLNFEQKERLHSMLGSDIRQNAEPIMKLFQGVPGAPGPFNDIMKERDPEQINKTLLANELSAEKLQSLDTMMKVMEGIVKRFGLLENVPSEEELTVPSTEPASDLVDDEEIDDPEDEEVLDDDSENDD